MNDNKSKHRVFVHDLANDLTIASGVISKALHLLEQKGLTEIDEEVVKLKKANDRVKDMVMKLKEYRVFIHDSNL